jgi:hypothetical protein
MRHGFAGSILIAALVLLAAVTARGANRHDSADAGRPAQSGGHLAGARSRAAWDIQDHSP